MLPPSYVVIRATLRRTTLIHPVRVLKLDPAQMHPTRAQTHAPAVRERRPGQLRLSEEEEEEVYSGPGPPSRKKLQASSSKLKFQSDSHSHLKASLSAIAPHLDLTLTPTIQPRLAD